MLDKYVKMDLRSLAFGECPLFVVKMNSGANGFALSPARAPLPLPLPLPLPDLVPALVPALALALVPALALALARPCS